MSDEIEPYLPELDADGNVVPWERLSNEPTEAFAAFGVYLALPPSVRSLKAAAEKAGIGVYAVRSMNANFSWLDRATAFDDHVERKARIKLEGGRVEMRQRHAALAEAAQRKALERLIMMDPMELSPKDLMYFLDVSAKLERVSRGEDPTKIEVTGAGGGPIEIASELSSEERAALMARVAAELAVRSATHESIALENIQEAEIVDDEDGS